MEKKVRAEKCTISCIFTNLGTLLAHVPLPRQDADRWNLLHPLDEPRVPWVTQQLRGTKGPVVVATDYLKIHGDQIRAFVPGRTFMALGTDGFGRSDSREQLRHFFEVNRALRFDREKAYGFRLQVPAGTAVRFEPGEDKRVALVAIGGNRVAYGINGLTHGRLDDPKVKQQALTKAEELGFLTKGAWS